MRTLIKYSFALLSVFFLLKNTADAQNRRYYDHGRRYGGGYYGRGPYHYIGERVYLHRPTVILSFGGYRYHYMDGIFYRPYRSYFQVIAPPIGIRIGILPYGYSRIMVGPDPYYYYNGIFYRQSDDYYEVVTPPVGAEVAELPAGAGAVVIDNKKY